MAKRKGAAAEAVEPAPAPETAEAQAAAPVVAFKAFDPDFKCRGFQYEVGATYRHDGSIKCCPNDEDLARGAGGFHSCEHPLDCFRYYSPSQGGKLARLALVGVGGQIDRVGDDTKFASAELTLKVELSLPQFIQHAVDYVFARAKGSDQAHVTDGYVTASSTGVRGAASSTGYGGAASSTGYGGAASSTGDGGAASSTGTDGKASAEGAHGVALAGGLRSRARATAGSAIFLVERDAETCAIKNVFGGIAGTTVLPGGDTLKPDTWYSLVDGQPVEVVA